ncbi:MAG: hypothetical protein AUG04_08440 [Deltaproteobacteria bacterium 13_1_20CM_2_69_21]|nr:MAG: hypothetical protein AUG04_08440 [Deltaproteobacteria bacterium 13_1_20CM_2_69_21]
MWKSWLAAAGAVWSFQGTGAGRALAGAVPPARRASQMTTYEARPERDAYAIQEEIKVHLRITNGNAGAIELGDPSARGNQPTYTVRGAGFEKVFSTDSLLKNPLEQKPPSQGTIRIAPGATWEATVPLQAPRARR